VYERKRGTSEWLIRKIEEIHARTNNKMKVGEKEGDWFETTKRVRQGSPHSPPLFTIYVVEILWKAQVWRSVVCRENVWSLAFADDLVIVPKSERNEEELGKVCEEEKAGSEC
jgi:hypothetical protein